MDDETYEISGAECIGESDYALLVEAPEFDEAEWIPKSQISSESDIQEEEDAGTLVVSQWLAEQRGWV